MHKFLRKIIVINIISMIMLYIVIIYYYYIIIIIIINIIYSIIYLFFNVNFFLHFNLIWLRFFRSLRDDNENKTFLHFIFYNIFLYMAK